MVQLKDNNMVVFLFFGFWHFYLLKFDTQFNSEAVRNSSGQLVITYDMHMYDYDYVWLIIYKSTCLRFMLKRTMGMYCVKSGDRIGNTLVFHIWNIKIHVLRFLHIIFCLWNLKKKTCLLAVYINSLKLIKKEVIKYNKNIN